MGNLLKDLRYSFRIFKKAPAFAIVILLSLSLGIAATTTIFTVIYGVLLAPPLYKDTNRLVVLWESNQFKGLSRSPVAPATFRDWLESNHSLEDMELVAPGSPVTVTGSELPERANIQYATPGLFRLLGVQPALGRFFVTNEIKSANPVVLSYGFWSRHFAGNSDVAGRQVTINGTAQTIVGVLPRDFHLFDRDTDLWMPIDRPSAESQDRAFRSWLIAVGKLRPGQTLRAAQTEMSFLAQRIAQAHPETNKGWGVKIEPIQEAQFGYWKPILYLLFGIVAFVLLISCANVANLLLGRLTTRNRELCLRASLGASRSRIVKQLLTEGLSLGIVGGIWGLALSLLGNRPLSCCSSCELSSFAIRSDQLARSSVLSGRLCFEWHGCFSKPCAFCLAPQSHGAFKEHNPNDCRTFVPWISRRAGGDRNCFVARAAVWRRVDDQQYAAPSSRRSGLSFPKRGHHANVPRRTKVF